MSIFKNDYNFIKDKKDVLKSYCKTHGLRVGGNKSVLSNRLCIFVRETNASLVIQRMIKGYLTRLYMRPKYACYLSVNKEDFFSLDPISDFRIHELFSITENGFVYTFTIQSLIKLVNSKASNPYTRNMFSDKVGSDLYRHVRLSKALRIKMDTDIESSDISVLNRESLWRRRVVSIFSNIDSHGHITDTDWFTSLNRSGYIRFLREMADIWNYRSQLSSIVKSNITPGGDPFRGISLHRLRDMDIFKMKSFVIRVMDTFVNTGINNDFKYMGCTFVLMALTLVSEDAAQAMPWLYDTVSPSIQIID